MSDDQPREESAPRITQSPLEIAESPQHPPFNSLNLLYNSNPFYFISAFCVLLGIRLAYGEIPQGSLDCWTMLGSLAGYTLLMACAAVVVIRSGKVWDDARSILVSLVLLFVAISVSFDELLIIQPEEAWNLTIAGWLFAAVVTELVLWLTGIRLGILYRGPYHAIIALLFWFPYFSSPELTGFTADQTQWRLLLFPMLTAASMLTLFPAIWTGRASVSGNTTPWPWPVYPWSLFVFLGVVCLLRSYVLTLSFGPSDGLETSFGALHLLPIGFALAILLLEAGTKHQSSAMRAAAMVLPACCTALLFADVSGSPAATLAMSAFVEHLGDPVLLAFSAATAFYLWAWVRRVAVADLWAAAALAGIFSTSASVNSFSLAVGQVFFGLTIFVVGVRTRSATRMLVGTALLSALWINAPLSTSYAQLRYSLTFHTALLGLMLTGPIRGGATGQWIIAGVKVLLVGAGVAAFLAYEDRIMTPNWTLSYIGTLACISYCYGRLVGDPQFRYVTLLLAALFASRILIAGFKWMVLRIGLRSAVSTTVGAASFLIAGFISLHKSRTDSAEPSNDYSVAAAD